MADDFVDLTQLINAQTIAQALGYAKAAGHPEWDEQFKLMIMSPTLLPAIAAGVIKCVMMGGPAQVAQIYAQMVADTEGQKPS